MAVFIIYYKIVKPHERPINHPPRLRHSPFAGGRKQTPLLTKEGRLKSIQQLLYFLFCLSRNPNIIYINVLTRVSILKSGESPIFVMEPLV
jgi:hypothetical protein